MKKHAAILVFIHIYSRISNSLFFLHMYIKQDIVATRMYRREYLVPPNYCTVSTWYQVPAKGVEDGLHQRGKSIIRTFNHDDVCVPTGRLLT